MDITNKIFSTYRVDKDKLLEYGFDCFKDVYTYSISFHNDEFELKVTVDEKGILSSKVIEKAFDEEYESINISSFQGGYVGEVREEYKNILLDIRDKCFNKVLFISDQGNRIASLIRARYNEEPDYPFGDPQYESYGVFRYKGNSKWYALLMNIPKSKLGDYDKKIFVDVINVKIDENRREEILSVNGIYPAYHMNKKKWASILLDESLSDEEVMSYIDFSRSLMIKKK